MSDTSEPNPLSRPPARVQIKAITDEAQRRIAAEKMHQPAIPDPPRGMARDGVMPGQWGKQSDTGVPLDGEMPEGCPVVPLGLNNDTIFLLSAAGQVRAIDDTQFGRNKIESLFLSRIGYAYWAWPRFDKKGDVTGIRVEGCRESLWSNAEAKGVFDDLSKIRGRGAWVDEDGALILHCGDCLYVNGKMRLPGEYNGFTYPRARAIFHPHPVSVNGDAAEILLDLFNRFTWARPKIDPLLLLGAMGVALFAGALPVRPSILITGDFGRGKTTAQEIFKVVLGDFILFTTDTTPAGIYQKVNQDARPVAIDELENKTDPTIGQRIVELARKAFSGGVTLRGGSNHTGIEFQSRSCFIMSMINRPPVDSQDLSRMGCLSLRRPDKRELREPPVLDKDHDIGPKFMRRMMDGWPGYGALWQRYKEALLKGGHDDRSCQTYGTLITCAHLLLGDEGLKRFGYPHGDDLSGWAELLHTRYLPEFEDRVENWRKCWTWLMTRQIDVWRGTGPYLNIGSLLEAYQGNVDEHLTFSKVNQKLAQIGLKLLDGREFGVDGAGHKHCKGFVLAVPLSSPAVARIFEGSNFGAQNGIGGWSEPLRDMPERLCLPPEFKNRITIAKATMRCVMIDIAALDAFDKAELAAASGAKVDDGGDDEQEWME